MQALLIGGTSSSCGKTTVTLALMAAFARRGVVVQGFKAGPDYIDPGLHALVTGRPSWNLDGWMCGEQAVKACFARVMAGAASGMPDGAYLPAPGLAVVEGVMGLYDGASGRSDSGSSAELAAWLDIPVILVVNARGMARSLAAMVRGYAGMRGDVRIGGVICTRTGSDSHKELLREALASACPNIPLLGCLPEDPLATMPSRHLGLHTAHDMSFDGERAAALGEWFSTHVDMDAIMNLGKETSLCVNAFTSSGLPSKKNVKGKPRIAVASDRAFCFTYPALYDALRDAGAHIVTFSPLDDTAVPECDGIWICGGYPELYAKELETNISMRASLRACADQGMPIHGECGGYIWLMSSLTVDDERFAMTGCFGFSAEMGIRRAALGYREMELLRDTALGAKGQSARGHEFHYGFVLPGHDARHAHSGLWKIRDRKDNALGDEGCAAANVSGTWIHVHPDSAPGMIRHFVEASLNFRSGRENG